MFDPRWADAISSIESGGNYGILGPVTKKGDRAYGRFQVMGSNIGPWTKEVLGRSLTPQEFLNNPQAQDAVFKAKFGQAAAKYGNPQDAASVWFTGRPLAQGAGKSDVLGTTGASYVNKFNTALGPQATPPPAPNDIQPTGNSAPTQPPPMGGFSLPQMASQPQQQMQQAPQQVASSGLEQLLAPQSPRRVNVTGLLQILQNNPQLRGLLQG